jgi:hypothetical protein
MCWFQGAPTSPVQGERGARARTAGEIDAVGAYSRHHRQWNHQGVDA